MILFDLFKKKGMKILDKKKLGFLRIFEKGNKTSDRLIKFLRVRILVIVFKMVRVFK